MSNIEYEYGSLYKNEEWGVYNWVFFDGNNYNGFNRSESLIECLNELGKLGWKLCEKSGDSEYILLREKGDIYVD